MIPDIALTSIETINAFDISTGAYLFTMDELQNVTISQGQETSDITGKHGRKLSTLKRNKTVTISGTNGVISGGLLEQQTGGKFNKTAASVMWVDYLTVNSNAATTTYKAQGNQGNEIEAVYVKADDGTIARKLEQSNNTSAGHFTYDPSTRALAFSSGDVSDGTEILVYYLRKISAEVLENDDDFFSKKCELYIDAMAEDKCANTYHVQIHVSKADFSGEFSLEIGDNQTVHSFECEALAGACGSNGNLWTFTVFGENDPDYPALSSIAITTAPTKTTYSAGEAFNATGMVVTATYADSSTANVTGYTFAPTGALATTNTSITVTYTENGVTKTATQAITVS